MFIKNTSCWQITPNNKSMCEKLKKMAFVSKQLKSVLYISVEYLREAGSCSSTRDLPVGAHSECC